MQHLSQIRFVFVASQGIVVPFGVLCYMHERSSDDWFRPREWDRDGSEGLCGGERRPGLNCAIRCPVAIPAGEIAPENSPKYLGSFLERD